MDYGRPSRRWRVPCGGLLIAATICATTIAGRHLAVAGRHRAVAEFHTYQSRMDAHRKRCIAYQGLVSYTRSDKQPAFDESKDERPVLFLGHSGPKLWLRFRGDAGISPPTDPRLLYSSSQRPFAQSPLWPLGNYDAEAAWQRRTRCLSSGLPHAPEVTAPPFYSWWGDTYDLFIHGRRACGGTERLVAINLDAATFLAGDPAPLWITVYSLGLPLCRGEWHYTRAGLGFPCPPGRTLRLFFGQPDPADDSHFTIRYDAGTRKGIIDGRLNRDDSVTLTARETSTSNDDVATGEHS
jgi:hypothetical protein